MTRVTSGLTVAQWASVFDLAAEQAPWPRPTSWTTPAIVPSTSPAGSAAPGVPPARLQQLAERLRDHRHRLFALLPALPSFWSG